MFDASAALRGDSVSRRWQRADPPGASCTYPSLAYLRAAAFQGIARRVSMGIAIAESALAGRMSGPDFRAFQDGRPDHERWELISGVPMMMTPPTIAHNRIAGNLERL